MISMLACKPEIFSSILIKAAEISQAISAYQCIVLVVPEGRVWDLNCWYNLGDNG